MADFTKKESATAPALKARLKNKDGTTATLTGATVTLYARERLTKSSEIVNKAVTILSATPPVDVDDPNVEYDWSTDNIIVKGIYEAHFKVVYADTSVEFFPDSGYLIIAVDDDIP